MTDPYTLPDGNVQIAFSGGRTSAYMLHHILEANGDLPERVVVSFQNTGREMPETLDFVQECAERWGVRVVWLEYRDDEVGYAVVNHNSAARDGEPFEAIIRKRGLLPNRVARFCTIELKVRPFEKYRKSLGWGLYTVATGIRYDEPKRHRNGERIKSANHYAWQPLVPAGVVNADILAFWNRQPFDLRLPTLDGSTYLGNCDGCFLKSERKVAQLAVTHPERHAWWERMEALGSSLTDGDGAVFSLSYSRRSLREFIEAQGTLFDHEDALCQADAGECAPF